MNMAWIKKVYLYLVSLVSLVILIIAGIMLINMALKTWVFTKADTDIYYSTMVADCSSYAEDMRKTAPECQPEYAVKEEQRQKDSRAAQKQRDAAQALAMIIVATPVFLYHWKLARKEA